MRFTSSLFGASAFALAIGAAWPLEAQEVAAPSPAAQTTGQRPEAPPEEIVITAERHASKLQKTALSVTAISGDDVATKADTSISAVLQNVPGVQIQSVEGGMSSLSVTGGGGPPNISIRGLGTDGPNKSSSTATYVDGVLWLGGGLEFFDLNRVEVLRGPQGTLYGRGATGGAVNLITNDPKHEFEDIAQLQYGSYDYVGLTDILNVPLSDNVAARLGINAVRHSGYLSNGLDDERDINTRLKVLYTPSDDFSVLIGGTYYRADSDGAGTEIVSAAQPDVTDWNTTLPGGSKNTINYKRLYATLDWNLGFANLTYIPSYQTTTSVSGQFGGIGKEFTQAPFDRTVTQEVRLSNPDGSPLTWTAGFYYYRNTNEQIFTTGPATAVFNPIVIVTEVPTQTSYAGFGELTYPILDTLRATVGLRETADHIQATDTFDTPGGISSNMFDKHFYHFDYKARLDTDLTPDNLLYAMISTGYRPGGSVNGQGYQNERVRAYEVGSKNKFDGFGTLNVAGFYYDYSGFQAPQSVSNPSNPAEFQSVIVSLPATIYGLDVEMTAHPTPHDTITLSPELLHGEWGSNFLFANPYDGTSSSIATNGGRVPHIPTFSFSGSYSHSFDLPNGGGLMADVDIHYQSWMLTDFDTSNYPATNPQFRQDGYTIVNAYLTYASPDDRYSVTVYGKNLSSSAYKLTVQNSFGQNIAYVNNPRTFGVVLQAKF